MDLDNFDDIIGIYENQGVVLLRVPDEEGSFNTGQYLGENVREISYGRIDSYTSIDVMIEEPGKIKLFTNTGTGIVQEHQELLPNRMRDAELRDVNSDEYSDLIIATPNTISIYLNKGMGQFTLDQVITSTKEINAVKSEDVDGDTYADIVTGTNDGAPVLTNDGTGCMEPKEVLPADQAKKLAAGDLTGDGIAEVITGDSEGKNSLWINDGLGSFYDTGIVFDAANSGGINIKDINEDGCNDIIITDAEMNEKILINDCYGYFAEPTPTPMPTTVPPTPTP